MNITVNLNESVSVEMTALGFQIWKEHDDKFSSQYPTIIPTKPIEHYKEKADEKGMVKMQIWELMRIFGHTFKMGMGELPFKNNNLHFIYNP